MPREKIVALMRSQGVTRAFWEEAGRVKWRCCIAVASRQRTRGASPAAGRARSAPSDAAAAPRLDCASRRHLLDGQRRRRSRRRRRRRPGAPRAVVESFAIAPDGGHQPRVRRLRPRDALHDRRRALRLLLRLLPAGARRRGDAARQVAPGLPWWLPVADACWQRPEGPGSHIARAARTIRSCTCRGTMRGPTAPGPARACRPKPNGSAPRAAGWTASASLGRRAHARTDARDATCGAARFRTRPATAGSPAPVAAGEPDEPNGYGLFNVCGNVWEMVRDEPAFSRATGRRSLRGGSFLCHDSYCNRYRVAARQFQHAREHGQQHRLSRGGLALHSESAASCRASSMLRVAVTVTAGSRYTGNPGRIHRWHPHDRPHERKCGEGDQQRSEGGDAHGEEDALAKSVVHGGSPVGGWKQRRQCPPEPACKS